ncbi:ribulose-phosphate 3-epimerase [Patescibacteria group bacterium]|nr:ribulose-phosphate 3-epimerase [Patescibacteria group bacterium]
MEIKIAPSILSADFGRLNEDIASVEEAVDLIHVDVMDGHFVPNITIGAPVVRCIKSSRPLDVHLMIAQPEKYLEDFAKAGADILTVHSEAVDDLRGVLGRIKELGMKASVSIKPKTDVSTIYEYLDLLDMVLVMTVEPGFGGQSFMEDMMPKVRDLRARKPEMDIEVDGGVSDKTAPIVKEAGANVLVAGSFIFGAEDRAEAIRLLRA